jgi:hypothetical protein
MISAKAQLFAKADNVTNRMPPGLGQSIRRQLNL